MKKTPPGFPRISPSLCYVEAAKAIDWLCHAFGFEVRLKVEGDAGRIEHSELTFGDGLIMVSQESVCAEKPDQAYRKSPATVGGGNTQNMFIYVDDIEAHCTRARAAGAVIVTEPATHDYGEDYWSDRSYQARDFEGHHWWFAQRLRDPQ